MFLPTSKTVIRPIAPGDRAQWETLWQGYQTFYKVALPDVVTETTWARFFEPAEPVHALVAEADGVLFGLVHYIFHRNTWMLKPACYLQDLFTAEAARGRGVGRALIEAVYAEARETGASRVYWMTHETNTQAMILYDQVAEKSGFLQYRKNF
jgi:GNAT superfamily N-acetyltransferase